MENNRKTLAEYRLNESNRCIKAAELAYNADDYKTSANRSYYAMFHCIRAVLALEGVDFKKHSAVIGYFRKEYIKTNEFESKYSDYIGNAFMVRGKSDYDDFYIVSKKDVEEQIQNAKEFYDAVKEYISGK